MNSNTRRFIPSPVYQGTDERIAYALTTTPWGGSPSSPVVVLKSATGADVTATYITGAASVGGDVITTGIIHSLVPGETYRLEIRFTCSGNVFETWGDLIGEV